LAGQLAANQISLTLADLVSEAHDTHHPISSALYYEDQRGPAKLRAQSFIAERIPKYLGWLEEVAASNTKGKRRWVVGRGRSYGRLSLFQVIEGLRYAFPKAMKRAERKLPLVAAVHDRVAELPRIAAYIASPRRLPFNENDLFRRYPELD